MKKIEGDAIFSRSFWNLKKSITFLFLIVVEKSPNISYRAMQYLQNELLTSILCQIELAIWNSGLTYKNVTFSFFHTAISRNALDLDKKKFAVYYFLDNSYKCAEFQKNRRRSVEITWWFDMEWPNTRYSVDPIS